MQNIGLALSGMSCHHSPRHHVFEGWQYEVIGMPNETSHCNHGGTLGQAQAYFDASVHTSQSLVVGVAHAKA
jgi:hypothetical protein